MEIEYEITADDLFAFQWRATNRSASGKRAKRKAYLYLFITLLIISVMPAISGDGFDITRVNYFFLAVSYLLVILITSVLIRRATRRAILDENKKVLPNRGQLGHHRLILNETELIESTAVGETKTSWAGVDRVEQNAEYVFLYTQPTAAHVIPKRAFDSASDADNFFKFALLCKAANA
jgi:hypothetical protein